MRIRIVSKGWETFSGSLGYNAVFENGVSVNDVPDLIMRRIASSLMIVDDATGEQVGPSSTMVNSVTQPMPILQDAPALAEVEQDKEDERERLYQEQKARVALEAEALEEARKKAETSIDDIVIYSRSELEAIAANDGINALRLIGDPLHVKGRSITDLIEAILEAQTQASII